MLRDKDRHRNFQTPEAAGVPVLGVDLVDIEITMR